MLNIEMRTMKKCFGTKDMNGLLWLIISTRTTIFERDRFRATPMFDRFPRPSDHGDQAGGGQDIGLAVEIKIIVGGIRLHPRRHDAPRHALEADVDLGLLA